MLLFEDNNKLNGGEYMELYATDMFFIGDNEKEQAYAMN